MRIRKLQVKVKGAWESRRELFLSEKEKISLITDRGKKLMEVDIDRGRTGFCHLRFKANILLDTEGEVEVGKMQPGDHIGGTEAGLSIQRVGKNCHSDCPIYRKAGCSLLEEILFLEVENPGKIALGEKLNYKKRST